MQTQTFAVVVITSIDAIHVKTRHSWTQQHGSDMNECIVLLVAEMQNKQAESGRSSVIANRMSSSHVYAIIGKNLPRHI